MNCCSRAVFPTSSSPSTTTLTARPPPHAPTVRRSAALPPLMHDVLSFTGAEPSSHCWRRRRLMESPRFTSAPCTHSPSSTFRRLTCNIQLIALCATLYYTAVCPSVRLSVILADCLKRLSTTWYFGSPPSLVLSHQISPKNSDGVNIYTVSQKTSHLWLAITLTHMNGFWHFWHKCY